LPRKPLSDCTTNCVLTEGAKLANNEAAPVVCLNRKPVTYGARFRQWTVAAILSLTYALRTVVYAKTGAV